MKMIAAVQLIKDVIFGYNCSHFDMAWQIKIGLCVRISFVEYWYLNYVFELCNTTRITYNSTHDFKSMKKNSPLFNS